MIPNLSSCKSPQQMFGALTKTYYAEKMGLDPHDIVCVSVMPCTAKKFEIGRDDMSAAGDNIPDVDISITTRELGRMIERAGIKFTDLPDEDFDPALGESTGAATIFGATGGVMEAALRTAVELVTGETLEKVEFHDVRGTDGIKEASYDVGGLHLNVCVASGLTNCDAVLKAVQSGEKHYDFIEFMACPGGCVNGGGQPTQPASVRNFTDLKALRAAALYGEDDAKAIRKSHENPLLKKVYAEYLGEPGGEKAHHILHTPLCSTRKNCIKQTPAPAWKFPRGRNFSIFLSFVHTMSRRHILLWKGSLGMNIFSLFAAAACAVLLLALCACAPDGTSSPGILLRDGRRFL